MTAIQATEGESLEDKFNKWLKDNKGCRVQTFNVKVGRDASNKVVETLYILYENE